MDSLPSAFDPSVRNDNSADIFFLYRVPFL